MKTTFLNQYTRGPIPATYPGDEILDGLGKFQALDRVFQDINTLYANVSDRFSKALDRQGKESVFLRDLLNEEMLGGLVASFPTTTTGIIDTIPLWLGESPKLEWKKVDVYLVDENLQALPGIVDYSIDNEKILVNAKKAPYTLVHYKLPSGANTSGFVVNCNTSEIVQITIKDSTDGTWQTFPSTFGFIQKQDKTYYDNPFSEIKIIVKNVTISDSYATYFSAYAIDGAKRNTYLPVIWNKGLAANSISINKFMLDAPVFFEGSLVFDGQSYNVQIPCWATPTSRLEIIKYTSLTLNTFTICKCPYPVDLSSEIGIFKSLNDYQSSAIEDWEGSVDGINWVSRNNINTLSYPLEYTDKPKYFYVRLKGFFDTAFIYYNLKKNINCAWPLTNNEKLFFNGSGLGIKNPELAPVQLFGNILFSKSDSYNESMPFGSIGID